MKKGITEDNASIYEEDGKTLKEMPILSDMYNEFKNTGNWKSILLS